MENERQGLYRLNVQTGAVMLIVRPGAIIGAGHPVSPDGKAIYYSRRSRTTNIGTELVVRNLETGQERELYAAVRPVFGGLALSPDGRRLVFSQADSGPGRTTALLAIPAEGGEPRELVRVQAPEFIDQFATWTPDGMYLLFGIGRDTNEPGDESEPTVALWRIPAEGGQPEKLGLTGDSELSISVHPDGRQIAFVKSQRGAEIWKMENFLPDQ